MKKLLSVLLTLTLALTMVACGQKTPANPSQSGAATSGESPEDSGKKDGYVIAFTDAFNGNTFHQTIEKYYNDTCEELKSQGILSDYILDCANGDPAAQVSQIENFIMMGVDAIIVDPTSGTALDGAIEEATAAGIPVISFMMGLYPLLTHTRFWSIVFTTSNILLDGPARRWVARAICC